MGLKRDHQAAALEALARGPQRRAHLLGMMTVVVDHQDVARLAEHLEAAVDAAELGQRLAHRGERHADLAGGNRRGERVQRVMAPRHLQLDPPVVGIAAAHVEAGDQAVDRHVARHPVRVGAGAVGDVRLADVRQQRAHARMVETEDGAPVERDTVNEGEEGLFDLLDGAEVIEMLGIDVRHHRDRR